MHIGLAADIAPDRDRLAAASLDPGDQRPGGAFIGGIVDRDAIAGFGAEPANRGTDAATAAGDQKNFLRRAHSWQPFSRNASHGTFEKPLSP